MEKGRRKWLMQISMTLSALALNSLKVFALPGKKPAQGFAALDIEPPLNNTPMKLGAFSISLNVNDVAASQKFYENLGFTRFGGDGKHYVIMKNGNALIGLFHKMFEKTMLTFNPGWDENAQRVDGFTDVRELQKTLKAKGVQFVQEADEKTTGPAHFILNDPDGNPVLIDQHV